MKTNNSVRWFLVGFSLLTFLSFVGVTTGTLAWYAYATRATIGYKGVSVHNTEQLQIGIVDDEFAPRISLSDAELTENNCYREHDIVWANIGTGFGVAIISAFLSGNSNPLYVSGLTPTTTLDRALDSTDPLKLFKAPSNGYNNTTVLARQSSYVYLPFVLRVVDNNNNYVGGSDIWLRRTEAKVISTDKTDITKSLRVFTEDPFDTSRRYLINPSSLNDGQTTVAGLLDLDHDGYYDGGAHDSYNASYELLYGSYTGVPAYTGEIAADSDLDDVNSTGYTGEANTFYARHKQYVHKLSNMSNLTLGKAYYYGMNSMQPELNTSSGGFMGGKPITSTSNSGDKLAYLNVTVFLEGWDHCVIDTAIDCQFNLGLTFEIDRV